MINQINVHLLWKIKKASQDNFPPELIKLACDGTIEMCMKKLKEYNQLEHFINLLTVLVDGQLKTSNIA